MTDLRPSDEAVAPPLPAEELGRVHFVGIGGAGMSGIARIMLARGLPVSGSDAKDLWPWPRCGRSGPPSTSGTPPRTSVRPTRSSCPPRSGPATLSCSPPTSAACG